MSGGWRPLAVIAFDDQPQLVLDLTSAANRAQVAAAIAGAGYARSGEQQPSAEGVFFALPREVRTPG